MKHRLIIIDDEMAFCELLERHLGEEYDTVSFTDPEEAVNYLEGNRADVVLSDLSMPKIDGLEMLNIVKKGSASTDVIIMTAYGKVETAIQAMKGGAYDFIIKPFTLDEISLRLKNLFEKRGLHADNVKLRKLIESECRPEIIQGRSEAAKDIRRFVDRVCRTDVSLLIGGESGTGKELVARTVHFTGVRKDRKLLSVHCVALPGPLIEGELFGYEKDALPGAAEAKKGLLEEAEGGTVIIDGIDSVGIAVQARLLAALERRTVRRIGGDREIPFEAMVIAITDGNLGVISRQGNLLMNMYYRPGTLSFSMPPLRERKEDIPLLAEHFFYKYRNEFGRHEMRLTGEAIEVLKRYHWPGNVRELKGLFAKICLLEASNVVRQEHILERLDLPDIMGQIATLFDSNASLADIEKKLVLEALKKANGNITNAAGLLKISYDTLRFRMKKFGMRHQDYKRHVAN